MKKERITVDEINAAAREKGFSNLIGIDIIVLEATGEFTIIQRLSATTPGTLKNVKYLPY